MKTSVVVMTILSFSFIAYASFAQTTSFTADDVFTRLVYNRVDLTGGEAVFIIRNPTLTAIPTDKFLVNFINSKGSGVRDVKYYILVNQTVNITDYITVTVNKTCAMPGDNPFGYPEGFKYDCSYKSQVVSGYHDGYELAWDEWNQKGYLMPPGESQIKVTSQWDAILGETRKEWIPEIEIQGTKLAQTKWAWWNVSASYKQPLEVNASVDSNGFVILANGTAYIDTATLISGGKLDSNGYCLWFVNSTETGQLYWHFENETSPTFGINTAKTAIWVNSSVFASNQTIYMYYGATCGESSHTPYMSPEKTYSNDYATVFHFGEESGSVVKDSTTTSNDGTFTGGPDFTMNEAVIGTALYFNGTTDYITATAAGSPTTNSFTVMLWFKTDVTNKIIVNNLMPDNPWPGYRFYLGTSGKISFFLDDQSNYHQYSNIGAGGLTNNVSHHIAFVVDRTANAMNVFVDGINYSTTNIAAVSGSIASTNNLVIGDDNVNHGGKWVGMMDEIKILNRTITLAEEQREYFYGLSLMQSDWEENGMDTTPPTVLFIPPTDANGTEDDDKTYIVWNISVSENASDAKIQINDVNHTATCINDSVSTYCYYNDTGLTANTTRCSYGWASDPSGNWGNTSDMVCRIITINVPIPLYITGQGDVYVMYDVEKDETQTKILLNAGITSTDSFWLCKDSTCNTTCQVEIRGGLITACT